jgi:hypothetical protein
MVEVPFCVIEIAFKGYSKTQGEGAFVALSQNYAKGTA